MDLTISSQDYKVSYHVNDCKICYSVIRCSAFCTIWECILILTIWYSSCGSESEPEAWQFRTWTSSLTKWRIRKYLNHFQSNMLSSCCWLPRKYLELINSNQLSNKKPYLKRKYLNLNIQVKFFTLVGSWFTFFPVDYTRKIHQWSIGWITPKIHYNKLIKCVLRFITSISLSNFSKKGGGMHHEGWKYLINIHKLFTFSK